LIFPGRSDLHRDNVALLLSRQIPHRSGLAGFTGLLSVLTRLKFEIGCVDRGVVLIARNPDA